MTAPGPFSIVVVGGGFTAAALVVHLAGLAPGPLDVHVVEPRAGLGRGVAYDTTDPAHRLNVPAARMSLFPADERHFERWLTATGATRDDPAATLVDGRCFPRRAVFGRYAAEVMTGALAARPDIVLRHHRATALRAAAGAGGGYRVLLDNGASLAGDALVLANSHPSPVPPSVLNALTGHPRYVVDPWAGDALHRIRPDDRVVIVGTGLTMADIVASLDRRGHRGAITALSRHGLLSRGHAPAGTGTYGDFASAPSRSALDLLHRVRREIAAATTAGVPWQAVVDALRRDGQAIWASLPGAERRRLLAHLRPWWDVHRYRIAPQTESTLADLRGKGRLACLRGHLVGADRRADGFALALDDRGMSCSVEADALVLATGPAHRDIAAASPVLHSLAAAGLIRPDPLGLGLAVDRDGRAVGAAGEARDALLVAGPLARGTLGELIGVPQVSAHARRIAEAIAALASRTAARSHVGNAFPAAIGSPLAGKPSPKPRRRTHYAAASNSKSK